MTLSVYAFLSLLPTLTNIAFAIFVYYENPRSPVNRLWSLTIACLIPWGLGEFGMRAANEHDVALFVSRIGGIGFCLVPAFFFHFALAYCRQRRLLQQRWLLPSIYLSAAGFAILQVSEYLTQMIALSWGYARTPAAAYPYFLIWLEILFFTGLFFCYRKFRNAQTALERKQTLFVILAVIIPLLAGSINDAILPLMGRETVRISVLSTTITAGLISYAIARFRLMALTPQATAESILDTMGDLLALVDTGGTVQYMNLPFRRYMLDGKKDESISSLRDFTEEEPVFEAMRLLHNVHQSKILRVEYKPQGGGSVPVSLLVSGIFDHDEKIGYVLLARDITEELRLQRELSETTQQRTADLKRYAISIQHVLEEERRRIARELHDDLCQRLTGMKLQLLVAEQELPKYMRARTKSIRALKDEIRRMIDDVRRISYNLRPTTLDDFGLVTALRLLCKDFQRSHNLEVQLETTLNGIKIDNAEIEIALYRIAQEALSNAALHGKARNARMKLLVDGTSVQLTVEDNGIGFKSAKIQNRGLGFVGMRERSELLGGTFSIDSKSRRGTQIRVEIPIEQIPN